MSAATLSPTAPTPSSIRLRLSIMMFLEFFIWGAWLPVSFKLFGSEGLKFDDWQQNLLNLAFPISAIVAMFFSNQFVDRNFSAEKFLAASHFIAGVAFLLFGYLCREAFKTSLATTGNFWLFFACMAIHCLLYVPTISVTNAIAFANVKDAQKDFGLIRLWGSIGWIAAAWPFIFLLVDWTKVKPFAEVGFVQWLGSALGTSLSGQALNQGQSWAFFTAGIACLISAAFSLTLPHTPPNRNSRESLAWVEAFRVLLSKPFLIVLFLVTWIDATIHDGFWYFAFTYLGKAGVPPQWVQPAMSISQIAEIGTMAALGTVLKNLGWRWTMIIGILGHTVRFATWAYFDNRELAVAINVVHGICYAFYFATLYILIDDYFPKDARTSAQGLFNLLILGAGPLTARIVWPMVAQHVTAGKPAGYVATLAETQQMLWYPAVASLVAAILLLAFFHPPRVDAQREISH